MTFPTGGASLLAFAPDLVNIAVDIEGAIPQWLVDLEKSFGVDDPYDLSKDAGNLKNVIQQNYAEVNNLINLAETLRNVGEATSTDQSAYKQLLAKSVESVHSQLLAGLRSSQSDILHQVALDKQAQASTDLQAAQSELASVTAGAKDLTAAGQAIMSVSHSYFETVARFAFYSARALEIYTLDDLSDEIRFDYGYVHPDTIRISPTNE